MKTIKIWSEDEFYERIRKNSRCSPLAIMREKRYMQMESRCSQTPAAVIHKCAIGLIQALETDNKAEEQLWRDRLTYCGIDYWEQFDKSDLKFIKKYS